MKLIEEFFGHLYDLWELLIFWRVPWVDEEIKQFTFALMFFTLSMSIAACSLSGR